MPPLFLFKKVIISVDRVSQYDRILSMVRLLNKVRLEDRALAPQQKEAKMQTRMYGQEIPHRFNPTIVAVEDGKVAVVRETLSDGSYAYNVEIGSDNGEDLVTLSCLNVDHAIKLFNDIRQYQS